MEMRGQERRWDEILISNCCEGTCSNTNIVGFLFFSTLELDHRVSNTRVVGLRVSNAWFVGWQVSKTWVVWLLVSNIWAMYVKCFQYSSYIC